MLHTCIEKWQSDIKVEIMMLITVLKDLLTLENIIFHQIYVYNFVVAWFFFCKKLYNNEIEKITNNLKKQFYLHLMWYNENIDTKVFVSKTPILY